MASVWQLMLGIVCLLVLLQEFGVDGATISKRSDDSNPNLIRHGDELLFPNEVQDDDEDNAVNEANTKFIRVGDQLMLVRAGEEPVNDEGPGTIHRRSAVKDESLRWSDKTIPYTFDESYTAKDKKMVKEAMDEWAKHTCLIFRPARNSEKHKVKYVQGDGCFSYVGMVDKTQDISLDKDGCRFLSTALHEIGHALGLYHTQVRPDRDKFVKVNLADVKKNLHDQFNKQTWKNVHHFGVAYDFKSIMHYDGTSFTSNGGTSIKTIDPKWQKIIGNVKHLSFGDIEMMNKMYHCKPRGCSLKDDDCPGISFVDKTCKCACPGPSLANPVVPCKGTGKGGNGGGETPVTSKPTTQATTLPMTDDWGSGGFTGSWDDSEGGDYWKRSVARMEQEWSKHNNLVSE